ncbi:MAG: recombinase RecT [Candidatus Heimdallarchaeota archaeon]|nr:recombinase RecT [Candidatus Heimdallarchaeota archaeon]
MSIIQKAISRLQTYEDALTGKLSLDDSDDRVVGFTQQYKNMAGKAIRIICSLRNELEINKSLNGVAASQILTWLNTALKYGFEFGKESKRFYLLPFNDHVLLYFGFEAYREVVEKQFKVLISAEPYSKKEIENYYLHVLGNDNRMSWDIPDDIPVGCQVGFNSPSEIYGFKVEQISTETKEVIKVKKYKAEKAILSVNYLKQTQHKPMWRQWAYEMSRKRAVMFHIKDEFVLKGNDTFSEMMNFELSQEKNVGLAN